MSHSIPRFISFESPRARSAATAAVVVGILGFGISCGSDSGSTPPATCSPACAAGAMCCPRSGGMGPVCVSVMTDAMNCGGCGIACPMGQRCASGSCQPISPSDSGPRPDGFIPPPPPGDSGADTGSSGPCMPTCSSDQQCCSSRCVNRTTPTGVSDGRTDGSFMNCGRCGNACDPMKANRCGTLPGRTEVTCLCGTAAACAGAGSCVLEGSTFRCVDSSTDPRACGSPPVACAEGERCVAGACVCGSTGARCPSGSACCGGMCVNVMTDPNNCGRCGARCSPGRAPDCNAGRCGCGTGGPCASPSGGFGGGELGEVCCDDMCVAESATNCASCGMTCAEGEECLVGIFGGSCCGDPDELFGAICPTEGDGGTDGSI